MMTPAVANVVQRARYVIWRKMMSEQLQGMYMNGPMAGRIINLPDPAPAKLTVAVNLNRCKHNPDEAIPMKMLEYSVSKPGNHALPYMITLTSNFDDTGWYCPQCKADAEVHYKLDRIRDILGDNDE